MNCEDVRLSLGAHALGALEPEEALEMDNHLATCDACLTEFTELSGLTHFLAKVSERDVELVTRPPRQVLDRLLNDRAKRHRRGRLMLVAAASVAVLAVGGTVVSTVVAQQNSGGGSTAASAPKAAESQEADAQPFGAAATPTPESPALTKAEASPDARDMMPGLTFKGRSGKVRALVTATSGQSGTGVTVVVTGVPVGTQCSLTVVSKSGARETAVKVWTITAEDYERETAFPGKTSFAVQDIARFDLVTSEGRTLLTAKPVNG
ncbi:anti-sigma factor family protein [Nonomuraea sp. NPDC050556]|uniref:anti-sigma factor family protein n=1 Tax=Nonomuraea sp. NPDC050556 TaxID=3364369 RepID=UPI0037B43918